MDQIKIGRFISEKRKEKKLTQFQLSEMLNVTDRAVSKWETGRTMPDSSIMLQLCEILGITVNDLLSGEVVTMNEYNKKLEQNLIDMTAQKQKADKHLLRIEIVLGVISSVVMFSLVMIASFIDMKDWLRALLICIGFATLIIAAPFAIRIEQTAGYYKCAKCAHVYVPTYGSVFMAMHMGRTRYMKCPHCKKRSWNKKVISKDMPES